MIAGDILDEARKPAKKTAEAQRNSAQAEHLASLPTQWRGKRYRRNEAPKDPTARERADDKKAERWSKEVLGLLLEADLPFAESAAGAA